LPFATLYGTRIFQFLSGILIAAGVVIARCFSGMFSLGAWIAGLVLFAFAWIGRSIAIGEASAPSTHSYNSPDGSLGHRGCCLAENQW
jgi:hypothetical protein